MKVRTKADYRKRRHLRIRRKLSGTAACPRMNVFLSNKNITVQFIDDVAGVTLASAASAAGKKNVEEAVNVGRAAAEAAKANGVTKVVFDRGGFAFGQRLRALADAAREAGLEF